MHGQPHIHCTPEPRTKALAWRMWTWKQEDALGQSVHVLSPSDHTGEGN